MEPYSKSVNNVLVFALSFNSSLFHIPTGDKIRSLAFYDIEDLTNLVPNGREDPEDSTLRYT